MGYACPVCDDPQQDTEHLANHLAFQALTHGDDHEAWLDEHAPGWADGGPADLAPRLAGLAEETEYEVVFDDTSAGTAAPDDTSDRTLYDPDLQGAAREPGEGHGHGREDGHSHDHDHGRTHSSVDGLDTSTLDPETREVVDEARALTREMLDAEGDDGSGDQADESDADGSGD